MKLSLAVSQSPLVRTVHHPDNGVRLLKVVAPVRPDRLLPSHVPDVELEALVFQGLDVESECRGDGRDVLVAELLQDGGLPGVVESS